MCLRSNGASRYGQAHSGGVHETIGLPMTQMETVANTSISIAAPRIPTPSQYFAVAMVPHITNKLSVISTYATPMDRFFCLQYAFPELFSGF